MTIVLFIIGLLLSKSLTLMSVRIDLQRIKRTQNSLTEIEEALLGFAIIHGRLPYPASKKETGIQDSKLKNKEGYLPWAELGVGRYDAWGNSFRYRAEAEYTETPIDYEKIFGVKGSGSGLRVRDKQNNYFTRKTGDSRVAAIIFSRGKNGVSDDDNSKLKKTYVYDVYIENHFDDILTWLSRNILLRRLNATGQLPP